MSILLLISVTQNAPTSLALDDASCHDALAARNRRLLIAIDQLEECLILRGQTTKDRLGELSAKLQKNPIEGLQLLFEMRTDYMKFDELTALSLSDPRPRENWFNIEALSHADARSILRQALLGMDERSRLNL